MYYRYVPKSNPSPYDICNTLFNTQTYYSKCVGYCTKKGKYLTAKQLKGKQCLKKQCRHLVKIESHPLWKWRDNKKKSKTAK